MVAADSMGTSLPPEKELILIELREAFSGDKEMIAAYLNRFGWSKIVAPNLRIIRREFEERSGQRSIPEEAGGPPDVSGDQSEEHAEKDPYYFAEVACPGCGTRFNGAVLRSKSLAMDYRYKSPLFPLMVPETRGAMKHYRLEDPLLRAVLVCPKCLYAAPGAGVFHSESVISGTTGFVAQLPERKLAQLKKNISGDYENRLRICGMPSGEEKDWSADRRPETAIKAFRLAARSLELLAEFTPKYHAYVSEAYLSAAKLSFDSGDTDKERENLAAAAGALQNAYDFGPPSAGPVYLLAVVHYHLEDFEKSRMWLGRLLGDRGQTPGVQRYRRYGENLLPELRARIRAL